MSRRLWAVGNNTGTAATLMWSAFNGWSSQNIVQNSGAPVDDCSIMINLVNGSPVVTWQPW
ncbi:hypothetical protein GTP81_08565 [Rugamonas sp. FT107W]|uniref:Uncharacterized protein n=1 Tax=Duganella vulcania TaxID=2692166 RepID=A0A845HHE1_9BURK|nr:hypothetical protein [Duganella vulcania]MYN16803.1 hypothetical protein [Duganella vulcania]